MPMNPKTVKILTMVTVLATGLALVVAAIGINSLHHSSAAFDRGHHAALIRCAQLHGYWLPDDSHKGYDHPKRGPGYCIKPGSILFAYPTLEDGGQRR